MQSIGQKYEKRYKKPPIEQVFFSAVGKGLKK